MLSNKIFGMCKHKLNGAAAWKRGTESVYVCDKRLKVSFSWFFLPTYDNIIQTAFISIGFTKIAFIFIGKKITTMLWTLICMLRLIGVSVKQNSIENMLCSRIWGQIISGALFFFCKGIQCTQFCRNIVHKLHAVDI